MPNHFLVPETQVAQWGVGSTKPMFQFYVFTEPAPATLAA